MQGIKADKSKSIEHKNIDTISTYSPESVSAEIKPDTLGEDLITAMETSAPYRELLPRIEAGGEVTIGGLAGSMLSVLIAALSREQPVLVVTADSAAGEALLDDLYPLLGEEEAVFLPPGGKFTMSRMTAEVAEHHRTESLRRLAQNPPRCLVALPGTLVEKFPAPGALKENLLNLCLGMEIKPDDLVRRLMNAGFKREVQVEGCGELALRGGILDLFPYGQRNPYRMEFWGDEIVSLREFDTRSQRSIRELQEAEIYISRRFKEECSVFDLMEGVVFWENLPEIEERYHRLVESEISPLDLLKEKRTSLIHSTSTNTRIKFGGKAAEMFLGGEADYLLKAERYVRQGYRVLTGAESEHRRERLENSLKEIDYGITSQVQFGVLPLQRGFIYPAGKTVFYTERELYDRPRPRRSFAKFRTYAHPVEPDELQKGDYVVHVDYGIGIFQGLKTIKVAGHERECLHILYKDNVALYVRLEAFTRVQKYSGREGFVPAINKIGGRDWERMQQRTKQALLEMAKDLITLQAKRQVQGGYAFAKDDVWQRQMEDAFVYQDTPDQRRAAEEIKQDMERSKPMDRLLLGDVGFGKTEVAVRAAFKAIQSNRQVAVLAPTTILTQQHLQTFKDRMASFPVNVASLSRFLTPAEQRKVIQGIRNGSIDIVIGTHRLLSKDVAFRRLGLLIIDEEHRFGVKHKEKLKRLRAEVDVLTLTATPIPRTLHLALAGARDMSRIETPPADRMPIMTEIVPFDKGVIREALMFELKRGGQVFFIHNRVRSIDAIKAMLSRVVPEARCAIAHGQMHAHDLEQVMLDFVQKKVDCLVCTMIIESGIDLPNVNTMVINRADKLGLAQLYQLRGRIGRSDRQAYAYLLIPPKQALSSQARSRLETISHFTELGAGFQVALKDLEIRGAGNILGAQQSGFINAIGFDMYSNLLEEAMTEIRREQGLESPEKRQREAAKTLENGMKITVAGDVYIPGDYIEDESLRVNFYRRMSRTGTSEELKKLEGEMLDRFGKMPEALVNLFYTLNLKLAAAEKGVSAFEVNLGQIKFELAPREEGYRKLIESAVKAADGFQIEFAAEPVFAIRLVSHTDNIVEQLQRAEQFLKAINNS